jgi:hypothetical protein
LRVKPAWRHWWRVCPKNRPGASFMRGHHATAKAPTARGLRTVRRPGRPVIDSGPAGPVPQRARGHVRDDSFCTLIGKNGGTLSRTSCTHVQKPRHDGAGAKDCRAGPGRAGAQAAEPPPGTGRSCGARTTVAPSGLDAQVIGTGCVTGRLLPG